MTEQEADKIIESLVAGRDECWQDLLKLRDYYNELRNKAVELGLKFEDINPDAITLTSKIGITEMRINHPYIRMPGENIPKMPIE